MASPTAGASLKLEPEPQAEILCTRLRTIQDRPLDLSDRLLEGALGLSRLERRHKLGWPLYSSKPSSNATFRGQKRRQIIWYP